MRKTGKSMLTFLAIVLFLSCSTSSQVKSPVFMDPKSSGFFKPKLEVQGGFKHDFGNIYRGQVVSHLFEIKNAGSDTLVILGVSASCGCTAAMVSERLIPPRRKGDLKVSFNSEGFMGHVTKHVIVSSNDSENPAQQLSVSANVLQVLEANPSVVVISSARMDTVSTTTIKVKNTTKGSIKILSVTPTVKGLTVDLSRKSLKPGESADLIASFKPAKEGMTVGEIQVQTDFQPQSLVSVRFTANVLR